MKILQTKMVVNKKDPGVVEMVLAFTVHSLWHLQKRYICPNESCMRILGRIPHPTLQITVFANDDRFPLQFEQGGLSQIYRFRKSEWLRSLADVQLLVDEELISSVLAQFSTMRAAHSRALNTFAPPEAPSDLDGLPDII